MSKRTLKHKAGYIKGISYCGQGVGLRRISDDWDKVDCKACREAARYREMNPPKIIRGNLLTGKVYRDD